MIWSTSALLRRPRLYRLQDLCPAKEKMLLHSALGVVSCPPMEKIFFSSPNRPAQDPSPKAQEAIDNCPSHIVQNGGAEDSHEAVELECCPGDREYGWTFNR